MRDTYQDLILPRSIDKGFKGTGETWREIKDDFSGKTILDVGCNQGYFMLRCLQEGAKKVIGVDLNGTHWCKPIGDMEKPLDIAQTVFDAWGYKNTKLIEGDWESVVIDDKIDIVLCLSTSHYFRNPVNALRKIFALGAELLIFEASPGTFDKMKNAAKEYGYKIIEEKPGHWNGYTIFKFRML